MQKKSLLIAQLISVNTIDLELLRLLEKITKWKLNTESLSTILKMEKIDE